MADMPTSTLPTAAAKIETTTSESQDTSTDEKPISVEEKESKKRKKLKKDKKDKKDRKEKKKKIKESENIEIPIMSERANEDQMTPQQKLVLAMQDELRRSKNPTSDINLAANAKLLNEGGIELSDTATKKNKRGYNVTYETAAPTPQQMENYLLLKRHAEDPINQFSSQ